MSVPVNFWHDFNAALFDTFNKPKSNCLARDGTEKQLWSERIDIYAKKGGEFPPYPSGLSLREVMVVLDSEVITTFVLQELKGMVRSFLGAELVVEDVLKELTVELLAEEELDNRYMIHIPFNILSVFVIGSQKHPEYLDMPLYATQKPRGHCSLVDDILRYDGESITVKSAFSRLQISNVKDKSKRLEVDISARLAVVFSEGRILRAPPEDKIVMDEKFKAYVQTTRKTQKAVAGLCREKIGTQEEEESEDSVESEEEPGPADELEEVVMPLLCADGSIKLAKDFKRKWQPENREPSRPVREPEVGVVFGERSEKLRLKLPFRSKKPPEVGVVIGGRSAKRQRPSKRGHESKMVSE